MANPRYASALAGRGEALLAQGDRSGALVSFEAASEADTSLEALRSRIDVLKLRGLQDDVEAARKAAAAKKLPEAKQKYLLAIAASPQSSFLYRELAGVEREAGDTEAALGHAQKAAEIDPSDSRTLVMVGEILESRGATDAALQSYSAALALDPNDALAARVAALRETSALAAMPAEYQAIAQSPSLTRAQLAALLGVRLGSLFSRVDRRTSVVITDTRASWASPWIMSVASAGVMEVYANHTFQPAAIVRRADLARAASRVLALVADEKPALGAAWRSAPRPALSGHRPRTPELSCRFACRRRGRHGAGRRRQLPARASGHGCRGHPGREEARGSGRHRTAMNLTVANQLTITRMLLMPAFVILLLYGYRGWALATFLVAAVTDLLDGLMARMTGQKTTLGAWLDPMADKLLLVTMFVMLTLPDIGSANRLPLWFTVLVISRDVVIVLTVAVVNLAVGRRTFRPSIFGKLATATYVVTGVAALYFNYLSRTSSLVTVLVYASLVITVVSAAHYATQVTRLSH